MAFSVINFINTLIEGFDVPDLGLKAEAWLKEFGGQYEDTQELTDKLAEFLATTIAEAKPHLDAATLAYAIKGAAEDIMAGRAGVDPDAGFIT